jgi:hypothetical protein
MLSRIMKKILLIKILFICTVLIQAQSDSTFVSVSAAKMNVLYIGVINPVDIGISNLCGQEPVVQINCGAIWKEGNNHYYAQLDTSCKESSTISVSYLVNGEKVTVEKKFRNKFLPMPKMKIAGKSGGPIGKLELMAQTGIVAYEEVNFEHDIPFVVISFSLVIKNKEQMKESPSMSYRFTEAQYKMLRDLKSGDKVIIQDIMAKGPDGKIRNIPPLEFIIVR